MQYRDGRSGRGMVVLDVHAPPEKVFELLTRFSRYESFIPTVRSVTVYGTTEKTNSVSPYLLHKEPLDLCDSLIHMYHSIFVIASHMT